MASDDVAARSLRRGAPFESLVVQGYRVEDGRVVLSVADNGVGIEEERLSQMFEPFFTTKPQGTGMGLAMNRAIIERHSGRICAESEPGSGTTFRFALDAAANGRG
ncbi:MAG: ATP-binding protein [Planctomycetota bacterium]